MSRSWTDDPECVDGVHEKVETHLIDDVIPTVDRSLRTIPARTGRIFAGMSAGGFCALNLDSGTGDRTVLREMTGIAPLLRAAGCTVELHRRPGAHTYRVWRPALSQALSWALQ
jgi:enterochelin esterase-like enzyme